MSTTFNMDPNYWDTLATNELLNTSNNYKNINIMYKLIYKMINA